MFQLFGSSLIPFNADCVVCPDSSILSWLPVPQIYLKPSSLIFKETNVWLEWYSGRLWIRWLASWADISHSEMLLSRSFCIEVSEGSSGSLLLRIWLKISEKAAERDSDLLAYFAMYCKAAWMLRIGLRSTFARQPCNCNRLCRLINESFLFVNNSGCLWISSWMKVWSVQSFGYLNRHTCWPSQFTRMQYEGLHFVCHCNLFMSSM